MNLGGFFIIGLHKEAVGQATGRDCQVMAWFSNLLKIAELNLQLGLCLQLQRNRKLYIAEETKKIYSAIVN